MSTHGSPSAESTITYRITHKIQKKDQTRQRDQKLIQLLRTYGETFFQQNKAPYGLISKSEGQLTTKADPRFPHRLTQELVFQYRSTKTLYQLKQANLPTTITKEV